MTTSAHLTLDRVSFQLPDGSTLFSDLDGRFDLVPTGLVGANGAGKSVLARLLAGQLEPTTGTCTRAGRVFLLEQLAALDPERTVASLAGIGNVLDALRRIENGSVDAADFALVDERWTLRQRLETELSIAGLGHLSPDDRAATLSGGECARVALAGAFLSDADFLVLDEPTNHLDRPHRAALATQLQRWTRGLVVISHDRELLEGMQRIVELTRSELRSYGGPYSFYAEARAHEQATALRELERCRLERQREAQALRVLRERQDRREARGNHTARDANQARILLGMQKDRSEASAGKRHAQLAAQREHLDDLVRVAARRVDQGMPPVLQVPECTLPVRRRVLVLEGAELPFAANETRIDLEISGPRRIGLTGPNGSGKSTLLAVLAGSTNLRAGRCEVFVRVACLDQHASLLDADRSVFEQLREANRRADASVLRTRLAQLGLDATRIDLPCRSLSGGERLKAAMACLLHADEPAQLLLLDEPNNHLDLAALEALEQMLCEYRGALIVASHDGVFLSKLELDACLRAGGDSWQIEDAPEDWTSA